MKVSTGWIAEYLANPRTSSGAVIDALARAGMEIEGLARTHALDANIVVAQITSAKKHPNADRLNLTTVSDGTDEFQVVCGAPNVRSGMKVALARVGTTLPGGDVIDRAKLRGVISDGMLCSEAELGLSANHEGILELPDSAVLGVSLKELYPSDEIADIKTPANRFDVQSMYGLAREVAGLSGQGLKDLELQTLTIASADSLIDAPVHGSARYILARIAVGQSRLITTAMAAKLRSAGVRSINPVVDVTNLVMLETGQPLHAFDAHKVKLPITVRLAARGETLLTLDGVERQLAVDDLVVADANGPIALAGIMGSKHTEVDDSTSEIILESATFDPVSVRKTAKRLGLRTEASARMERGLPVELPEVGMSRALVLLGALTETKVVKIEESFLRPAESRGVTLPLATVQKLLGFDIAAKEVCDALNGLQIPASSAKEKVVVESVPWWRPDLKLAEDLVEEVVRVVGYDRVPSTLPDWRPREIEFDTTRSAKRLIRDVLFGSGLFEVMTYSFSSEEQIARFGGDVSDHLKLKNPLNVEQAYLRSSLLPNHMNVLQANRTYGKELAFYEVSRVFVKSHSHAELPAEPELLGVTLLAVEQALARGKGLVDALSEKLNLVLDVRAAEAPGYLPGHFGHIYDGKRVIGSIGRLKPGLVRNFKLSGEVVHIELAMNELVEQRSPRQFRPTGKFPAIERDITVSLPVTTTWRSVQEALRGHEVTYLGQYQGKELRDGYKNLSLRLVVSGDDRTPTEDEAAVEEARVTSILMRRFKHPI